VRRGYPAPDRQSVVLGQAVHTRQDQISRPIPKIAFATAQGTMARLGGQEWPDVTWPLVSHF
jgi:hypothetical protein